ncbi:MAG: hypothetical protein ACRENP_23565, partial [Longimicrobiales bacterium]
MTRNLGVRFVAGNHGPQLRDQVRQIDAALPIYQVDRFTNIVQRQTSHERLSTVLLTSFALLAIALVVGGIYAVIALEV